MFIGHYGVALALRPLKGSPSLPVLFAAVQAVDIAFFSFLIPGIERMRIVPGATVMNSMDLYFLPYTHSLVGAAAFSVVVGGVVAALAAPNLRWRAFAITALAVFSHWLLDLLVHRPDLGIIGDSDTKLGLGLWNYPAIAMPLEIGIVIAGLAVFIWARRPLDRIGVTSLAVLALGMVVLQAVNWFAPQPAPDANLTFIAIEGLVAYAVAIGLAWWAERATRPSASPALAFA